MGEVSADKPLAEGDDALDAVLVALWQCETERGFDHMAAKVRAYVAKGRAEALADVLADDAAIEVMRKAIEDELIEWRDEMRFMICGNGFSVCEKDGSPSPIIRFRTDIGLRIGLSALIAGRLGSES